MDEFTAISNNLMDVIHYLFEDGTIKCERETYNIDEKKQLEYLNHVMNIISDFMHQTADQVRPDMEEKRVDSHDPMFDFEIEVTIEYALCNDDPEYKEDDDNYLSTRTESLSRCRTEEELNYDFRCGMTPEPFHNEPISWLLYSLTESSYGAAGPRVQLKDCLRIGEVHLDVQVWYQYIFDINAGKWVKRRGEPEWIPEYVNDPY